MTYHYNDHKLKKFFSFLPNLSDLDILFSPEFAVNLVWVSYAYAGWNSSIYVVGEIQKPGKNIFRSILIGTTVVTFLYILINYSITRYNIFVLVYLYY